MEGSIAGWVRLNFLRRDLILLEREEIERKKKLISKLENMKKFNQNNAKRIGKDLHINWKEVDLREFTQGLNVELEHGSRDSQTNVTDNDGKLTGEIAWAHLKEFPDYYTRLAKMEKAAKEHFKKTN